MSLAETLKNSIVHHGIRIYHEGDGLISLTFIVERVLFIASWVKKTLINSKWSASIDA